MKSLATYIYEDFKISRKTDVYDGRKVKTEKIIDHLLTTLGYSDYSNPINETPHIINWIKKNDVQGFIIYTTQQIYNKIEEMYVGVNKMDYTLLSQSTFEEKYREYNYVNSDVEYNSTITIITNSKKHVLFYNDNDNQIHLIIKKTL